MSAILLQEQNVMYMYYIQVYIYINASHDTPTTGTNIG